MSGDLPTVEAVRTKGASDEVVWVVRRCTLCGRRHTHVADAVLTSAVLPAGCDPTRFYRLREPG